jgi:hypothetical protein
MPAALTRIKGMCRPPQLALLALLVAHLFWACAASASPNPTSACSAPTWPTSSVAAPPATAEWSSDHWPRDVTVPACLGWDTSRFASFAAVAGTFHAADIEDVLRRIGAISAYKGLRYWSVTDHRLEPLIIDAFAVADAPAKLARQDFAPAELTEGRALLFSQRDKDLRTALFISQAQDGTWTCYVLSGFHSGSFASLFVNRKSHVNRVLALYGRVAAADDTTLPWEK